MSLDEMAYEADQAKLNKTKLKIKGEIEIRKHELRSTNIFGFHETIREEIEGLQIALRIVTENT